MKSFFLQFIQQFELQVICWL